MDELMNAMPLTYEGLEAVALGTAALAGCSGGGYASGCSDGDTYDSCSCGPKKQPT